jgi:hypothetical protein
VREIVLQRATAEIRIVESGPLLLCAARRRICGFGAISVRQTHYWGCVRQTHPVPRIVRQRKLVPRAERYKGRSWETINEEELARAVADLALGQWHHVERILTTPGPWPTPPADYAIDGAIRDLTVAEGTDPWHRDGWVFQMISWIVAVESKKGPARPPQMDQASKGFDGLQLITDRDGQVKRLVIFEDKATDNPRDVVRDDVWPALAKLESGVRDHALAGELAYLVGRVPGADPQEVANRVLRNPNRRSYRVSLTVGSYHSRAQNFAGLFDGYELVVEGARRRRYGNVFEVDSLREWMAALCARAVEILESRRRV